MTLVDNNGNVLSDAQFRANNPLVSFPAILTQDMVAPFGMNVLQNASPPPSSSYFSTSAGTPTESNGVWTATWTQTPIPVKDAQSMLLTQLAALRYQYQTTPITINAVTVLSTTDSITLLSAAISSLTGAASSATVNYKASSGWAQLTLAQLQAFYTAISVQVQACFTNEYNHTQKINALTDTASVSTYDITTGW